MFQRLTESPGTAGASGEVERPFTPATPGEPLRGKFEKAYK
jgi:hypothetical protein